MRHAAAEETPAGATPPGRTTHGNPRRENPEAARTSPDDVAAESAKLIRDHEQIAYQAAIQARVAPTAIEFIEARGPLCLELLHLVGGRVAYRPALWREFVPRLLELVLPISPIARWYPPDTDRLECVGYAPNATRVYRLSRSDSPRLVFFVDFRPDHPAFGNYVRPIFRTPLLNLDWFLRPPFDETVDHDRLKDNLRAGVRGSPLWEPLIDEDGRRFLRLMRMAECRGLWRGFTENLD